MLREKVIKGTLIAIVALALVVPSLVTAQGSGPGEYYAMNISGASVTWVPLAGSEGPMTLTITGPDGYYFRKDFNGRAAISSRRLADGLYHYELVLSSGRGDGAANENERGLGQSGEARLQSGAFTVSGGAFVTQAVEATDAADIVQNTTSFHNSICVGFDCLTTESYGSDTIRLKENNLRIHFDDTSTGTFPANDWRILVNDTANGGASFLAFNDVTGSKTPFKVTAGAATNSIFVDSTGRVGFRTGTPVLDLHVTTGNTPAMRLEQNGSGGYSAQTWDIGANEANFFVRDVTSGSRLSFRIRPGAPTSSIDISADGDVGIGTASPEANLDVKRTGSNPTMAVTRTDGAKLQLASGPGSSSVGTTTNHPILFFTNGVTRMTLATNGDMTVTGSVTATAFNPSSDRHIKENFGKVNRSSVLDRLARIPISTWNFIGDNGTVHMGPMAQDFYAAFGLGTDDKHISTVDADGVAFAAIQELNLRNEALASENASLRGEVTSLREQMQELAARVTSLEAGDAPSASFLTWALAASNLAFIVWMLLSTRRASVARK
ncbi:MAG: tail fiber domain-containing protein [Chloroflexi bacterium]|nr:tail fiber domain-containing protein [Chloroflexota bacterium]